MTRHKHIDRRPDTSALAALLAASLLLLAPWSALAEDTPAKPAKAPASQPAAAKPAAAPAAAAAKPAAAADSKSADATATKKASTADEPAEPSKGPLLQIGVGGGAYIPTSDLGPNFLVGIDVGIQLPFLQRKFGIAASLAYSQPPTDGTISDSRVPNGAADYDSTMRELVLDLQVTFRVLSWASRWSPHVGIGPVFYFLKHEVNGLDLEQSETSTQVGFRATVGADFRLGPGAIIGEVRIPFATVSQTTTGESNVGAVSIVVGYRFRI